MCILQSELPPVHLRVSVSPVQWLSGEQRELLELVP